MNDDILVVVIFGLLIFAGVAVLWMAMQNRRMQREFEHRERLAMIERGLVPPPELDPAAFESRTGLTGQQEPRSASRSRSAGIIMIGFGLGLTMLISFAAGDPEVGIGIGGAFALLGAAFIFNSMAVGRRESLHGRPREVGANGVTSPWRARRRGDWTGDPYANGSGKRVNGRRTDCPRTGHRHSTTPRRQRSRCAAAVPAPCSSHHGGRPTLTPPVQRHRCPTP